MIIASGPYLSEHFVETVERNGWPVVDAGGAAECGMAGKVRFIEPGDAVSATRFRPDTRCLTSGEHALAWVGEEMSGSSAERAVRLFKDKVAFRQALQPVFPDLSFRELPLYELGGFVPDEAMYPFVIKPAVGFFSIGVRTVREPSDWTSARLGIAHDIDEAKRYFPGHMLSQTRLILESFVEGEEFAVDAYYDASGVPSPQRPLGPRQPAAFGS